MTFDYALGGRTVDGGFQRGRILLRSLRQRPMTPAMWCSRMLRNLLAVHAAAGDVVRGTAETPLLSPLLSSLLSLPLSLSLSLPLSLSPSPSLSLPLPPSPSSSSSLLAGHTAPALLAASRITSARAPLDPAPPRPPAA